MTTREFLDAIKARYGLPSDYALAHFLGLSKAVISSYRVGKTRLDDANALKVAKLLYVDPGYVLASIHAERARRDDVRKIWQKAANTLKRSAGALLVCLLFYSAGGTECPRINGLRRQTSNFDYYVKLASVAETATARYIGRHATPTRLVGRVSTIERVPQRSRR